MDKIVINESKKKTVKRARNGGILLIASIALLIVGIMDKSFLYTATGVIGTIFFGLCVISLVKRITNSKPLLVITDNGIEDSSSASAFGYVGFDEIEAFEIMRIGVAEPFIVVKLKDQEAFMNKLSRTKRRAREVNMKLGYPAFSIGVEAAEDKSIEEIHELLKSRLEIYRELKK